jgi:hypothetical protein
VILLFFFCAVKDLFDLQAPVSGREAILPALSRAIHLESGIVGKCRLSAGDDRAAFFNDFILAAFLFWNFYAMRNQPESEK